MTEPASAPHAAPVRGRPSWLPPALGSAAAAALVVAVALRVPEPLLGGRLPQPRLKQLSDVWLPGAFIAAGTAGLLSAFASRRRRVRFPESPFDLRNYWRGHAWLLLLWFPAIAVWLFPASSPTIAASWSPWCVAFAIGGWLTAIWNHAVPEARPMALWRAWLLVLVPAFCFAAVFATLAILQYRALHVPHGDAGMYEEHLWNLLHGKGFRSQLDDGRLFLGEHIEFIHVLLAPIYLIRRELPTLNVCQAIGLALGAVAVFGIARRLLLPVRAAVLLAGAYLCWFPMQALALEQTWKTFRPETLAVPCLLFAFWLLECERSGWACLLFAFSWTAKEELALVTAFVGAAMCLTGRWRWGLVLAVASLAYLVVAVQVLIPYFRGGAPPHYTPYFESLGDSPREIAVYVLAHPWIVLQRVFTGQSIALLTMTLAPWFFLPAASARRFLPALPVFGYLMLADPEKWHLRDPRFHFHAPLVGVLPWAAAWGLDRIGRWRGNHLATARFVFLASLLSCVWFGRGPMSYEFYEPLFGVPRKPDPASPAGPPLFEPRGSYWWDVYLPSARSEAFRRVLPLIQPSDRVAATDYVRTRFTHCRAAHDYPTLRAHATIDDVDVLVLDKTEGWWGRDPKTNRDRELLDAMNGDSPTGVRLSIRGATFEIVHHDDYFLVVRRAVKP